MITDVIKNIKITCFLPFENLITKMLIVLLPNMICHNLIVKLDPIQTTQWLIFKRWSKPRGNSLFCNVLSGIIQIRCQATEYKYFFHVGHILLQGGFWWKPIKYDFLALPMGTWNKILLFSKPVMYCWNIMW